MIHPFPHPLPSPFASPFPPSTSLPSHVSTIHPYWVRTCFNAASRATHLALEPHITPSAYCNPNFRMAGCIALDENLQQHVLTENLFKIYRSCQRHSWLLQAKVFSAPPMEPIINVLQTVSPKHVVKQMLNLLAESYQERENETCTNFLKRPPPLIPPAIWFGRCKVMHKIPSCLSTEWLKDNIFTIL